MFQRQLFICSAIEQCKETVNCCPHKLPHIKDERCVPRECRHAPGAEDIDCVRFDPEKPAVPQPVPAAPAKTVEQKIKEGALPSVTTITKIEGSTLTHADNMEHPGCDYPTPCTNCPKEGDPSCVRNAPREQDIKAAVKKQAAAPKKTAGKKVK